MTNWPTHDNRAYAIRHSYFPRWSILIDADTIFSLAQMEHFHWAGDPYHRQFFCSFEPDLRESIQKTLPNPLPPHSSHLFQALDLSLFGITKRLLARLNKMEGLNVQSDQIGGMVCSFMSAATSANIVKTFLRAGISLVVDDNDLLCRIDPEKIIGMSAFKRCIDAGHRSLRRDR
jgi:hypothetical protein